MPSPKSGKTVSPDAPAAPAAPPEAAADAAGEVSEATATTLEQETPSYRTVTIEGLTSEPTETEEEPEPTLTVRWSKQRVTPDHNSGWPPATPPTDTIPEEAKVQAIAETTNVPDDTEAEVMVRHCLTDSLVEWFPGLEVRGGRVVDPATGNPPEMVFNATHDPYETWDIPMFYFECDVSYRGLAAATPWQWISQEAQCLRVMWYHMCVADAIADTPAGGGLTTQAEMNEIKGIIDAKLHHKSGRKAFNNNRVARARWGSVLRNTYSYHHASHGDVVSRRTGAQLNANGRNPPIANQTRWRSVIILGSTSLGDAEVSDTDAVPSTPKYLAYLDTCVAGWEPSFANAFIDRGTQNVIAFRMYIPDGDARAMARRFHRKWIGTHNGDPQKINPVFFEVGASYYWSMRPVLFGYAGGAIVRGGRAPNIALGNSLMEAEEVDI